MRIKKTFILGLVASLGFANLGLAPSALAAGEAVKLKDIEFSFEGPFGTFDRAAAQRGFQVYREICSSCHSAQYFAFRNLEGIGYSEEMAKAIAAEYQITDGPDDFGDMFERPGKLSDRMPAPFPNQNAARAANGGAYPPDLSVIVKARPGGADYLYSLLTGYEEPPADIELAPGQYYNAYMAGHKIAMPQPLYDDMVGYADGTEATVEQMAKDVTVFLAWLAEPSMEQRKSIGFSFMIFMSIFVVLLYLTNRRIWRPIKKGAMPWVGKDEKA
ncbi:cytochrome c [Iodidimonas nitroreducens]|uniref:Cytochrome c1 n=1 Tax=Iodidimonas nitroreducens TaxID=1236968 RepID=A0A5A7N9R4_9PROT|nr:cytochrome c1 [Iodidimonas nitroreducens]GAK34097.1 cytochrome c1, heme protein, mitochondrial [alpha proteobacterium Q-1]GER03809.1 cytochrome c [Iodidimonas nitroreducens]